MEGKAFSFVAAYCGVFVVDDSESHDVVGPTTAMCTGKGFTTG
jgi:hypothetical protein